MRKRYVIVHPNSGGTSRALVAKFNRKGGLGGYDADSKMWMWLAITLLVAWFLVPTTWQPLSIVLFVCGAGCGWHFWWNQYVPQQLVTRCGLEVTTDAEIIGLDKDWLAYIASLPEDEHAEEDSRRFITVRRLNNTSVDASRTEEILLLRRTLQGRS